MGIPFPVAHWAQAAGSEPGAGYALWLNPTWRTGSAYQDAARSIPAAVGDLVGGLYDATNGITATATGAARPTRAATGLTFAGAQWLSVLTGARGTETIYVVAQIGTLSGGTYATIFGSQSADNGFLFAGSTDANWPQISMLTGISALSGRILARITDGSMFCAACVFDGPASVLHARTQADGAVTATNAASTAITASNLWIGRRSAGLGMLGTIREILVYRAAHDAATRTAEIAKAAARCGVAL
jgi:hypothetical protein